MEVAIARIRLLLGATAVFALLIVPPTVEASGSGDPTATASSSVKKKLKKLNKKVKQLQQQLDDVAKQSGPQGAQGPRGPAGTAPACQGNDANDKMVKAGSVCIDRYEASIWDAPTGGNQITGAIPCNANGQDCDNIYARSVAGVTPRGDITYFQAQQALANVGKRLPTNAEWQQAVAGTPDSTACNVSTGSVANTGANAGCVSNWGANDMVGNLNEWVADWEERADGCANWPAGFGSDLTCLGDATSSRFPGALVRGGRFSNGTDAGPFYVDAGDDPLSQPSETGFRGTR